MGRCEKIGREDEGWHFSVKESPPFREDGALDCHSNGEFGKDDTENAIW